MNNLGPIRKYENQLEKDLISEYGILISGNYLYRLLGFPSKAAFRQGISKKQIHVPIFRLENRRGRHALAKDIAKWLTKNRFKALEYSDVN